MNQLNSLILEGNVCKEPEIKEINGERNLATFSIAVNRYYKKSDGDFEQEVSYRWKTQTEPLAGSERQMAVSCICRSGTYRVPWKG